MTACTSAPSVIKYDWKGKEVSCESTLMLSDSSLVGVAGINMIGFDKAVLYERGGDYCLRLCEVNEDSLVWLGNLLRRGWGPGEALMPMVYYMPELDKIYVFRDNMASTEGIFWLDAGDLDNGAEKRWNVRQISGKKSVRLRLPVDASVYLADAAWGDNDLFMLYSLDDPISRNIGLGYPAELSHYSPQTVAMVLSGFMAKRPGKNTFVNSSQHGHFVQIFDLQEGKATNIQTLYNEMPQFDLDNMNGGVRFRDDSQLGFWVFATEKYIYLLDAGVKIGDMRQGKRGERTVNIFKWDGTPVRKLHFDREIVMFSVTPDDKYLYFNSIDLEAGDEQIRRVVL